MVFDDDFVRLKMGKHIRDLNCKKNGLDWPPPELITVNGFLFRRLRYSQIPDEDRATMANVARGAEYEPVMPGDREFPEGEVLIPTTAMRH